MDPPLATEFKRGVSGFHFFGDTANFSATSQGHGVTDSAPIGSSRGCRRGSEMQLQPFDKMGYFLRSSVAKNPSKPEFKPGRTVEPVLAPPGFDFLSLIRACIPQSYGPIGEEDLGVDRDNPDFGSSVLPPTGPLRECAPTHKQTRDNVQRRRNRERRWINCGAESNAEVQTAASFPLNTLPIIAPTLVSKAPPLASPSPSPLCPSPSSLRNSKRAGKRKRKAETEPVQAGPSKRTIAHVLSAIEVDLEAQDFDAAHGAHTAKPGTQKQRGSNADIQRRYSVEDLVALGFRHIPWDGLTPYPLINPLGRVIGVLAGTPGSGYAEDLLRASDLILQEGKQAGLGAAAPNPVSDWF
ncbi:hypothetical protein C8R41DRAFT_919671 [Lentinula lateritia]|uniref:Uncharacterized protein n=1 Tax=Lentinula lateritia TaxID=40482 RepID=A0ABQ8VIW1_9AGAR|nr:hypothetical protein C8R41DRAFT_919671 [Lentinula lateritia]